MKLGLETFYADLAAMREDSPLTTTEEMYLERAFHRCYMAARTEMRAEIIAHFRGAKRETGVDEDE